MLDSIEYMHHWLTGFADSRKFERSSLLIYQSHLDQIHDDKRLLEMTESRTDLQPLLELM